MLVVGLGNPGTKYSSTKHNFGFWVLDKIAEKSSLKWQSGYGDYLYAKQITGCVCMCMCSCNFLCQISHDHLSTFSV